MKGSPCVLRKRVKAKYTFIKSRLNKHSIVTMCRILAINRSGFYAWLKEPQRRRTKEDQRLLAKIKQFWMESGCAYGYRNVTQDLKDYCDNCGHNRVYRIMKASGVRSMREYKRHRGFKTCSVSHVAPTRLKGSLNGITQIEYGSPILRTYGLMKAGSTSPL